MQFALRGPFQEGRQDGGDQIHPYQGVHKPQHPMALRREGDGAESGRERTYSQLAVTHLDADIEQCEKECGQEHLPHSSFQELEVGHLDRKQQGPADHKEQADTGLCKYANTYTLHTAQATFGIGRVHHHHHQASNGAQYV